MKSQHQVICCESEMYRVIMRLVFIEFSWLNSFIIVFFFFQITFVQSYDFNLSIQIWHAGKNRDLPYATKAKESLCVPLISCANNLPLWSRSGLLSKMAPTKRKHLHGKFPFFHNLPCLKFGFDKLPGGPRDCYTTRLH